MNADDLKAFRAQARLSQTELADLIGLKLRAYQELEAGKSTVTPRHWQALERVSLKLAIVRKDIGLALPTIRADALDYAALVRGEAEGSESLPELMIAYGVAASRLAACTRAENPAKWEALQADVARLNARIAAEKRRQEA